MDELVGIELMLVSRLSSFLHRKDTNLVGDDIQRDPGGENNNSVCQLDKSTTIWYTASAEKSNLNVLEGPDWFYGPESESEDISDKCNPSCNLMSASGEMQRCRWAKIDQFAGIAKKCFRDGIRTQPPVFTRDKLVTIAGFNFTSKFIAVLIERAVLNSARASRLRRNLATHANSVSIRSAVTSTASLSLNCVASILKEVVDAFDHLRGDH